MAYTPRLACLLPGSGPTRTSRAVSPIREKPVTVVTPVTNGSPFLAMTLSRFAIEGRPLEARVPWWDETIWFVPGVAEVEDLLQRGVSRGRIWTAAELLQIADPEGLTDTELWTIATIKAAFGCTVLEAVAMGPAPPPTCRACRETAFWTRADGRQICARCHPPADRPSPADQADDPGGGRP
jgi:hypothetical protein